MKFFSHLQLLIVCLLFLCLTHTVSAVEVNYTTPICNLTQLYDGKYVQDGSQPPVCLVVTNPTTGEKMKSVFFPTVDEFTLLEIDQCKYQLFLPSTLYISHRYCNIGGCFTDHTKPNQIMSYTYNHRHHHHHHHIIIIY
jgi:hypothetical protein